MKQFKHINRILGVDSLESIDRTASLHLSQIEKLNEALRVPHSKTEIKIAEIKAKTTEIRKAATKIRDESQRICIVLDEINPLIKAQPTLEKKIEAIRALLAAKPGVKLDENFNEKQPESIEEYLLTKDLNAVDWKTIDALEHNKQVDNTHRK